MPDYRVDLRDIRFNLFDVLELGALCQHPRFADFDQETFDGVLQMAVEQSKGLLHPLNESGDRRGVRLENGRVKLPEGWRQAYEEYAAAGWNGLSVDQAAGGTGMPVTLNAAATDIFTAANISFLFTPGLTTGAAGLLVEHGTEEQKKTYVPKMLSGEWSGTMCLTEPTAGTAVPDLKSTAVAIPGREGFYKIRGQKIFISAGDHDLTDNIVHMVLARIVDDPAVKEEISLFIVPRLRPAADGRLEYNDVATVGVEEKLGIHASPTCQLSFGEDGDCEGWLLGPRARGLQCMFRMMNEARIAVGLQGVGLGNYAYQIALAYAKERVQGTRIQDMRKPDAERVAIIEHPDVRRNLLYMKSVAEGARALAYYAAYCHDRLQIAADDAEKTRWEHQLEILTPMVKAWSSDEGFKATELGIQVHGGYGYIREYGAEQLLRDCKIASIYEGTNGVQALDLLGRKIARKGGVMFMTMLNEVNKTLSGPPKDGPFGAEVAAIGRARDAVAQTAMDFAQRSMKGDMAYSALHATPFLQMFGDTIVSWLLLRQAIVAKKLYDARQQRLDIEDVSDVHVEDEESRFLHGKMAGLRFFVHQILPRVQARLAAIRSEDRSALEVTL